MAYKQVLISKEAAEKGFDYSEKEWQLIKELEDLRKLIDKWNKQLLVLTLLQGGYKDDEDGKIGKILLSYKIEQLQECIADAERFNKKGDNKIFNQADLAQLLRKETGAALWECIKIVAANPMGTISDWKDDLRRVGRNF